MSKVLILGGTNFIGRRLVEKLLDHSEYTLTLFNRGKTNHALFPNLRRIIGNRENSRDLDQLFAESWDYVIDLSCYYPSSLRYITRKINSDISKYIFISTCSVYANDASDKMLRNEEAPVLLCHKAEESNKSIDTYGKRKAACEAYLKTSHLPYVIFRPSLVYGPYDNSDRLYYWIHATHTNQVMILPENGERPVSITYVEDLVNCILLSIRNSVCFKTYNCISHPTISIAKIVNTCSEVLQQETKTIAMDAAFLKQENISEWFDIPLWLNTNTFTFSNKALENDFNYTPIDFKTSMQETISYYREKGFPHPCYGIDKEQQNSLIKKYTWKTT